jgi:SAM-dependent methyltransferase
VNPDATDAASLLRVRADDPEYRRVAAAEAAYWHDVHPASLELLTTLFSEEPVDRHVNRRFTGDPRTHWSETIARWGTFERGLLLGTSSFKLEARILETNPRLRLTILDLSAGPLERRRTSLGERFPGRVATAVGDLNFVTLPEAAYDVVISSSTIHHVTNLEHLAFQIRRALVPGGYFFLDDYVGEPRFGFSEAKKRLFETVYARDLARQPGRKPAVVWKDARDLSPFCGVRSDESSTSSGRSSRRSRSEPPRRSPSRSCASSRPTSRRPGGRPARRSCGRC